MLHIKTRVKEYFDMSDQVQAIASNYLYVVPIVMVLTGLWLIIQKRKIKNNAKNAIMDNGFLVRNVLFVGLITFLVMYLGKPIPYEDSILVRPADF